MCGAVFRMDAGSDGPGVQYVLQHPEILDILFQGCGFRILGVWV